MMAGNPTPSYQHGQAAVADSVRKDPLMYFQRLAILTGVFVVAGFAHGQEERIAHLTINRGEPNLFVDDYFVDNRFNAHSISARVPHVLHQGERLPAPLFGRDADKPWEEHGIGYPSVVYDVEDDLFRLYYQIWNPREDEETPMPGYATCVAESRDGIAWTKPMLDLYAWGDIAETNIVLRGENEGKAMHVQPAVAGGVRPDGERVTNLGTLPAEALRGHRYIALYCDRQHYLAASEDGLNWTKREQRIFPNRVDCFQSICFDPRINEYVIYYRNKRIYEDRSEEFMGNTRMVARIGQPSLWAPWDGLPETVLVPDGEDAGRYYNMPAFLYGGVYFGFLSQFHVEPEKIEVELVWSRDGYDWERAPGRPMLIPAGAEGTWDSGMVFSTDRVIERDDAWWLYYTGHDGYHDGKGRVGRIGLVKFRKEGFVSIQADASGEQSYVVTKPMRWPGGALAINADAEGGHVKVRVTDPWRKPIEGFSYEACTPLEGSAVRHVVSWGDADMNSLAGTLVRLEFTFQNADLFGFVAMGDAP